MKKRGLGTTPKLEEILVEIQDQRAKAFRSRLDRIRALASGAGTEEPPKKLAKKRREQP